MKVSGWNTKQHQCWQCRTELKESQTIIIDQCGWKFCSKDCIDKANKDLIISPCRCSEKKEREKLIGANDITPDWCPIKKEVK